MEFSVVDAAGPASELLVDASIPTVAGTGVGTALGACVFYALRASGRNAKLQDCVGAGMALGGMFGLLVWAQERFVLGYGTVVPHGLPGVH